MILVKKPIHLSLINFEHEKANHTVHIIDIPHHFKWVLFGSLFK